MLRLTNAPFFVMMLQRLPPPGGNATQVTSSPAADKSSIFWWHSSGMLRLKNLTAIAIDPHHLCGLNCESVPTTTQNELVSAAGRVGAAVKARANGRAGACRGRWVGCSAHVAPASERSGSAECSFRCAAAPDLDMEAKSTVLPAKATKSLCQWAPERRALRRQAPAQTPITTARPPESWPWSLVPGQARVSPRYPQLGLSKKNVMPLALTLRCATS